MKLILLATALLFGASALPEYEWNLYKAEYNKVYTSELENIRRLQQYLKTKAMVEEHNRRYERGETSYTMGINQFADWFPEEISKLTPAMQHNSELRGKPFELPAGTSVPDSINWVEKGAVTSVKNQKHCGSFYAFSAVGALEGLMFRTNNTITDLSEQELVDCSDNYGCNGGLPEECFRYVANRHGIDTEKSYPYEGTFKLDNCRAKNGTIGTTCSAYVELVEEDNLKLAVGTVGPVSIAFSVDDSFIHYKSGIFNGTCSDTLNHAMLAVGYGTDKNETKEDYWLVKNSWGTKWGDKGYVRILRGVNVCGIGQYCLYPIYHKWP